MNNPTRRDPHEVMGRHAGRRPDNYAAHAERRRTYYESATDREPCDDWKWTSHTDPGYTYPADAHLVTLPLPMPPRRRGAELRGAVIVLAMLVALVVAIALAYTADDRPHRVGDTETPPATTLLSAPARGGWWPGEFTAPEKTVQINPYTDSGVWLVPGDIPPGRYRVQVTGELGGYLARCATPDICEDQATGLIANWEFPVGGQESTVDIADTDYSVRTAGVRLVPA